MIVPPTPEPEPAYGSGFLFPKSEQAGSAPVIDAERFQVQKGGIAITSTLLSPGRERMR